MGFSYRKLGILLLLMVFGISSARADVDTVVTERGNDLMTFKDIEQPTNKGKWLPVPIPVSNPTVGNGLVVGLLYLHPEKQGNSDAKSATSGIGYMSTDTESWFTGGFHDNNWFDDRLRFTLFLGTGEFNLKYYGVGSDSIFQKRPVRYNIKPIVYSLKLLVEPIKNTDWYFGISHLMTSGDLFFKTSSIFELLPDIEGNLTTSGLGVVVNYDSRDNTYYPSGGSYFESVLSFDDPAWKSDFTFRKLTSFYNHYFSVTRNGVLAVRAYLGLVEGSAPFYMLPSLSMRGFATGRYSDEAVLSGHLEWRHKIFSRWGYILSFESGYTNDALEGVFDGQYTYSVGAGLRWQVLSTEKLHLGLDFGINNDDHAVCIQVGERF